MEKQLVVHDPIHGSFTLPEIAWHIINTPEFQRLRRIKQTGNTHYVYPGADHSRFQHCLGVAHLSLLFGETIKQKNRDLITDHQIILLCVAGLCHDLGHCSFSHLYDQYIIPMFDSMTGKSLITSHEEAGYLILKRIWNRYDTVNSVLSIDDINTIGKMIFGSGENIPTSLSNELSWTDYDMSHSYLYEVVSNYRTGIDVDKFDYLKRDSHFTGIPCTFDPQRLMNFLTFKDIIADYSKKADEMINSMWLSRDDLHRRAYQHRVVKCIDLMTVDMIKACADTFVPGTSVQLKYAHHDLDVYLLLTDYKLVDMIENNIVANSLFYKVKTRNFWETVATIVSREKLDLIFKGNTTIRFIEAQFREEYVYYIFHAKEDEIIDAMFFVDLINNAKGGEINLRIKDKTRWISHLS